MADIRSPIGEQSFTKWRTINGTGTMAQIIEAKRSDSAVETSSIFGCKLRIYRMNHKIDTMTKRPSGWHIAFIVHLNSPGIYAGEGRYYALASAGLESSQPILNQAFSPTTI